MPSKPKSLPARMGCLAHFGSSLILALAGLGSPARADTWPSRVEATYRVAFNGFDVGKFEFRAGVSGSSYSAEGDAQLSALLGAFRWQGVSRSAGLIVAATPKPAGYTFDFRGVGKEGSIKMGFQQGNVMSITSLPPKPPSPGTIPVHETHLKGVLDPLSAVLALSRTPNANPCGRRIPIFDGKQRFDLSFTYVRQMAVAETRPSGQPGVAFVCRVRYVPIAGHRMTADTRHMATTDEIEVALRPVPSANLFVPYRISIPTIAGWATLTSERINIVTRSEEIALTH